MNNSKNKLNSEIILIFHLNPNAHCYVAFDTGESTLLSASRFLVIWMPSNIAILMFGFIGNLLRVLEM